MDEPAVFIDQTGPMKMIGLLGGMSWESSILYEELINTEVRRRRGGLASADLIIRSYDFSRIEELQTTNGWDEAAELLGTDAQRLVDAGAELIMLCTNTMHKVAFRIEEVISVPFVHLADATAAAILAEGLDDVGLLGTRFTMEEGFYRERLESHGISVRIPSDVDRARVHEIIYGELVRGEFNRSSREDMLDIIDRLGMAGAHGVVAGCTEIELLVTEDDVSVPFFPTTRLHAHAAVDMAL